MYWMERVSLEMYEMSRSTFWGINEMEEYWRMCTESEKIFTWGEVEIIEIWWKAECKKRGIDRDVEDG